MTADGAWTAQFEHTILITKSGYKIMTLTGTGAGAALKPGSVAEGPKLTGMGALGLDGILGGGGAGREKAKAAAQAKAKAKGFGKPKS